MGDEMLAKVCELAFEVAKEGDAPSAMTNYLYLAQRPRRAYSVAQRELEEDPGFRARVAAQATIENVGEKGYLWLHRPDGWESRFAALSDGTEPNITAAPASFDRPPMPDPPAFEAPSEPSSPPSVDSIELELGNLRDLVDRLADERQNVRSSVSELEEELETRRAENLAMSTHLSALRTELSTVHANEGSVAAERDSALERVSGLEGRISELETSIAELEANTQELEANVGSLAGEVDRLQSELTSSNAERDGALADLAVASAERDEAHSLLNDERAGSGEQISELSAANEQLIEDNTELASRVAVAEQARLDLESQLEDVSAKWQEASRQLARHSTVDRQLEAVEQERDQLSQQLREASEQLARVRSAADTNHEQLVAALADVERAVAPVDETTPSDEPTSIEAAPHLPELDVSPFSDIEATDPDDTDLDDTDLPAFETPIPDDEEGDDAEPELDGAESSPVADEPVTGRTRIGIPRDLTDEVDVARHVVSTPDVVLLIDGDGAAGLGWPHLDVAARRSALVNYLGQLTADTGAAADVVFERPVGGEDSLPVSRAVRVRIADLPVRDSPLFGSIVDGYPEEWPIAVVSDEPAISDSAESMQVTHLANGQLLDLFLYLSSNDS